MADSTHAMLLSETYLCSRDLNGLLTDMVEICDRLLHVCKNYSRSFRKESAAVNIDNCIRRVDGSIGVGYIYQKDSYNDLCITSMSLLHLVTVWKRHHKINDENLVYHVEDRLIRCIKLSYFDYTVSANPNLSYEVNISSIREILFKAISGDMI